MYVAFCEPLKSYNVISIIRWGVHHHHPTSHLPILQLRTLSSHCIITLSTPQTNPIHPNRTMPETRSSHPPPTYDLLYHPGIPGRGEFIRLAFEATRTPYTDMSNSSKARIREVYAACSPDALGSPGHPPALCPPMLRVRGAPGAEELLVSQTPNILLYLGRRIGLAGEGETDEIMVNGLALTALDLNNEVHESHHPISSALYYEDQKPEAAKRTADLRESRIPKFLGYFERVLKGNESVGGGKFLVGGKLSYADLCLWQVLDGLMFALPREMEWRKKEGKFPTVLGVFYEGVRGMEAIGEYLGSKRRLPYSMGVFRHYPELDRQD
jgi:glutathione S-transferase